MDGVSWRRRSRRLLTTASVTIPTPPHSTRVDSARSRGTSTWVGGRSSVHHSRCPARETYTLQIFAESAIATTPWTIRLHRPCSTRDGIRTRTPLGHSRLKRARLPITPPGHVLLDSQSRREDGPRSPQTLRFPSCTDRTAGLEPFRSRGHDRRSDASLVLRGAFDK